jgi:excisionase family DNA binding protein
MVSQVPEPIEIADRWFYRPREVAELAGVSLSEVYRSLYAGQLRAQKYKTKVWLISKEDAQEWIKQCSEPNIAA